MLTEQSRGFIDKSASVQQETHRKNWFTKIISFQNNLGANEYRKDRRINGLQLPLHPLQIVGWFTLIVFVLTAYLVIIPTFRQTIIRLPLYVTISVLLVIHVVTHIAALIIDPADIELRKISTRKVVPEFDRSKHSHVIENGRCHLCNIKTSSQRTKHCSVCNKCVQEFDHHCKYLNSCVSKSRNYVPFLMCVASAVAAVLVILAAAVAQIVLFYVNPGWLSLWDKTSVILPERDEESSVVIDDFSTQINQLFNNTMLNETLTIDNNNSTLSNATKTDGSALDEGIGFYNTIFLIIVGIVVILAAITAGLLLHLCFFHVYICYLGLTTYEYIRNHRHAVVGLNVPSTAMKGGKNCSNEIYLCSKLKTDTRHRPKTLHCCDLSSDAVHDAENATNNNPPSSSSAANSSTISQKAFYVCTVLEETTNEIDTSNEFPENASSRTLHCCSEFAHITKSQNGMQKIVQYSEQCAFCSFRIKSSRKVEHQKQLRCCVKTNMSKHHRWRRKWNCCSNVPNSPEDIANSNSLQIISPQSNTTLNNQPSISGAYANVSQPNYVQIEIPIDSCANTSPLYENTFSKNHKDKNGTNSLNQSFHHDDMRNISTISAACSNSSNDDTVISSRLNANSSSSNNNVKKTRSKLVRPWPVRLRYVFRMINRYRRPRCRGNVVGTLKQNQVRPLPGAAATSSENNIDGNNGDSIQYDQVHSNAIIPSAPAPNRRKIKNSTDLQDLADSLSNIKPSTTAPTITTVALVPTFQGIRRPRRKNILLRNKSPTLSPIHESGLSNPASPQLACKHACSGSISSLGNSGSLCGNNKN
jgi:palmitoyltransferase ZDHHC1/11